MLRLNRTLRLSSVAAIALLLVVCPGEPGAQQKSSVSIGATDIDGVVTGLPTASEFGGKGSKPRAVHIQLRPDPLAR